MFCLRSRIARMWCLESPAASAKALTILPHQPLHLRMAKFAPCICGMPCRWSCRCRACVEAPRQRAHARFAEKGSKKESGHEKLHVHGHCGSRTPALRSATKRRLGSASAVASFRRRALTTTAPSRVTQPPALTAARKRVRPKGQLSLWSGDESLSDRGSLLRADRFRRGTARHDRAYLVVRAAERQPWRGSTAYRRLEAMGDELGREVKGMASGVVSSGGSTAGSTASGRLRACRPVDTGSPQTQNRGTQPTQAMKCLSLAGDQRWFRVSDDRIQPATTPTKNVAIG